MQTMVQSLLEYSRIETQGDSFESVDLKSVVDDVRMDLLVRIEESNAEITAAELPRVKGDASQLQQLFQNLLSNAIEYSGDEPLRVRITAENRGTEQVILISDADIGIETDDQQPIFEVFQRLHTIDEHSGSGIGLATYQRIVESHDGAIWVESEPGDGSTFSFTLPSSSAPTV